VKIHYFSTVMIGKDKKKDMRDTTKYSSYWLRDGLFDDDTILDKVESKHSNLMALASYKKAIGNFVNIVTNEHIPVTFDVRGDNSYTDGKSVTISAKMDDKDFDSTVGLALHEGSHIKLTDFNTLKKIQNDDIGLSIHYYQMLADKHYGGDIYQAQLWVRGLVKDLLNVIEETLRLSIKDFNPLSIVLRIGNLICSVSSTSPMRIVIWML